MKSREEKLQARRDYYQQNKEKLRADARSRGLEYYRANRDKVRANTLFRRLGLSDEDHKVLLAAQSDVCGICGLPEVGKALAVDHCHTSGKIRGLLCQHCNTGLGKFRDSPELLQRAIQYLEEKVA